MAFDKLNSFTKPASSMPDDPTGAGKTPDDIRSYWQSDDDELKTTINNVVDKLNSTTDGESGADNIGATGFDGTPSTPQAMLEDLNTRKAEKGTDWTGTWQGFSPSQVDQTIRDQVNTNTSQLVDDAINVKHPPIPMNGAKGDGSTDDTTAIQNIINYVKNLGGGNIFFPLGIFNVSTTNTSDMKASALLLDGDNINFVGVGPESVIKANGDGTSWFNTIKLTTAKNIKFINLKFDGNADNFWANDPTVAGNGYHNIYFNPPMDGDVDNILILGCHFRGSYDSAIQSYGASTEVYPHPISKKVKIIGCHFEETGAHGVGMNEWYDSLVSNNTFYDLGKKPVLANGYGSGLCVDVSGGCKNVVVIGNLGEKTGYGGFKAETHMNGSTPVISQDITFIGNTVRDIKLEPNLGTNGNGQYALRLNGKNIKAIGNTFDGYYGRGCDISNNADSCEVINNTFIAKNDGNGQNNGIDSSSNNGGHIIRGNKVINAQVKAIIIYNTSNVSVCGNQIVGGISDGVYISGTSKNISITDDNVVRDSGGIGYYIKSPADRVTLVGNMAYDTRTGTDRTQQRGVLIETGVTNVEMDNNQFFNHVVNDYSVFGHLTQRIINGKKLLTYDSVPQSGTWAVGDYVDKITKQVLGSAGSQYVLKGWTRITNGTSNVLNTDWVEDRALTGS